MATTRDIIEDSLRLIGVLGTGMTSTDAEAQDALRQLNRMLETWNLESMMSFSTDRHNTLALTASTQTYTIGTGGTFNVTRPIEIEGASIRFNPSSEDTEIPLGILYEEQWHSIPDKDTESTVPSSLYYEPEYPLGKVHLWPIPSVNTHQLILYVRNPLGALAALATTVQFPPGYEEAIVYNLAVRLAPGFGRPPDVFVIDTARTTKAKIKIANARPRYMKMDEGLTKSGGGVWDNRIGAYR